MLICVRFRFWSRFSEGKSFVLYIVGLVVSICVLRVCRGTFLEAWVADLIFGMIWSEFCVYLWMEFEKRSNWITDWFGYRSFIFKQFEIFPLLIASLWFLLFDRIFLNKVTWFPFLRFLFFAGWLFLILCTTKFTNLVKICKSLFLFSFSQHFVRVEYVRLI